MKLLTQNSSLLHSETHLLRRLHPTLAAFRDDASAVPIRRPFIQIRDHSFPVLGPHPLLRRHPKDIANPLAGILIDTQDGDPHNLIVLNPDSQACQPPVEHEHNVLELHNGVVLGAFPYVLSCNGDNAI